jgi:hypothetical protein
VPLPLPPAVGSPIYASRPGQVPVPQVYVQNVLAGSTVTVYAQPQGASAPPVAVSGATPAPEGGNIWVALTQLGAQGLTAKSLDDRFHESCHKRGIHLGFRTPI